MKICTIIIIIIINLQIGLEFTILFIIILTQLHKAKSQQNKPFLLLC